MKVVFNPRKGKPVGFESRSMCFQFLKSVATDGIILNEQLSDVCTYLEQVMYIYNPALKSPHWWCRWWRWLTRPHFLRLQVFELSSTEIHVVEMQGNNLP